MTKDPSKLLNYTTTVPTEQTLTEIERLLVANGARRILVEYSNLGEPEALSFAVPLETSSPAFRLPANIEGVHLVLQGEYAKKKIPRQYTTMEQARRVAWRVLKTWIESQLALIRSGQASIEQIMLPYLRVDAEHTLYEVMAERQFLLPAHEEQPFEEKGDQ